jgi:hypothetical protein
VASDVAKAHYSRKQEHTNGACDGGDGPFHVHVFSSLSLK